MLIIGGRFSTVDAVPVDNVAKLASGRWARFDGGYGFDREVHSIAEVDGCIYFGGSFKNVTQRSADGALASINEVVHAARACRTESGAIGPVQGIQFLNGGSGPVRTVAAA
eukprot:3829785-Rhodomonas_salina.1